jgi:electron transfer flavoprotein alpha subunit
MSSVLVVLEDRRGRITRASWEAMAAASHLADADAITAVVLGSQTDAMAAEAATHVAGKVIRVEHPLLAVYTPDGYAVALQNLIQNENPTHVVFPHTYQVRDYAPALAARFGQLLISDVTAIGEGPVFTRQLMQGRVNGSYRHTDRGPCFISIQAGAFSAREASGGASVATFTPVIEPEQIRTRPGEPYRATAQTVDLATAQRIVSIGRGIQDTANIPLAQELAKALDAELAGSRPVCDAGWLPMDRQVGSSGQIVAPRLYIAAGISGAIQHLVGMRGSQCIVAINRDPAAPIFEVADYALVGDVLEMLPALTAAVKAFAK